MSTPPAAAEVSQLSHAPASPLPGIETEPVDIGAISNGSPLVAQLPAFPPIEIGDPTGILQQAIANGPPAAPLGTKLSQQSVCVDRRIFLDPDQQARFNCDNGLLVYGVISACPRKQNGDKYRIDWTPYELPLGLDRLCLREWIPKSVEVKAMLLEGVNKFQLEELAGVAPVSLKRKKNIPKKKTVAPTTGTPTEEIRYQRRAALMTLADQRSISSISGVTTLPSTAPTVETVTQRRSRSSARRRAAGVSGPLTDSEDSASGNEDKEDNLNQHDSLYGFTQENDYMEDIDSENDRTRTVESIGATGKLAQVVSQLEWKFELVPPGKEHEINTPYNHYEADDSGLRPGVSSSFKCPSECMSVCGGLTYKFVARLAANSNDYFRSFIAPTLDKNLRYCSIKWKNITTAEMYVFLGIMLKISLAERDAGGYTAYFHGCDRDLHTTDLGGRGIKKTLPMTRGWALDYMSLNRYKQMRSAFHPENKDAGNGGDRCHQIRHALNCLNRASLMTFLPGQHLAFDEGGISCRSRRCPVRQYSKEKPDKYRVDFFILADSSSYAVLHMDVYQGRNSTNAFVDERAAELPTTQKAVLNAIYQCCLDTETGGYRHLAMDNRYQCPEIAVILRDLCNIHSTGTTRRNRKGFDNTLMNLPKVGPRGDHIIIYDKINKLIVCQWRDSKVVSCVSTILDSTESVVDRRVGKELLKLPLPSVLKVYQKTMFGVDKGDQIRAHGGGFARKAHFQKWYKKTFFAVLDVMLLNSLIAWNMSVDEVPNRRKFQRYDFFEWIADDMLHYDEDPGTVQTPTCVRDREDLSFQPALHKFQAGRKQVRCVVCHVDSKYAAAGCKSGVKSGVVECVDCCVSVHNHRLKDLKKIHLLSSFEGMTCHEIYCSPAGRGIWRRPDKPNGKSYNLQHSHPIIKELQAEHMYQKPARKKRARSDSEDHTMTDDNTVTATMEETVDNEDKESDSDSDGETEQLRDNELSAFDEDVRAM